MDFGKGLTEKFQQTHSFACVGVSLFIQRFPQYRDSDTTPDDGQHQDVDTGFAVFPCRAVEGEADVLPAENREDEAGNIGSADKVPGKETLHTAIDGFRLGL